MTDPLDTLEASIDARRDARIRPPIDPDNDAPWRLSGGGLIVLLVAAAALLVAGLTLWAMWPSLAAAAARQSLLTPCAAYAPGERAACADAL